MDNAVISVKLEKGELIDVKTFKFMVSTHTQQASRLQFPLKLAWSMTIHQAQRQTLGKVQQWIRKQKNNKHNYRYTESNPTVSPHVILFFTIVLLSNKQ